MDGELLFSEVNDDFLSTADTCSDGTPYSLPGTQNDESFAELSTLIPGAIRIPHRNQPPRPRPPRDHPHRIHLRHRLLGSAPALRAAQ